MTDPAAPAVRAAGAVVWRRGADGVEVLVVHRPRYDDWSLPKGKLDPGETDEQAAVREVHEETGLRGSLGPELAASAYIDHQGRPKTVRYWAMEVSDGAFTPSDEVDEVAWLAVGAARARVSYARDVEVIDSFAALDLVAT
ncbi:MAG TPA: NUDIX hydrolase [Acidimicrobiales bacterium]|nr:NUDIX hydrolase [Acidimicrobiales bacterium]